MLQGELGAHLHTVGVNQPAIEDAVRSREVDVLKNATRPSAALARALHRPYAVAVYQDSLARLYLPDEFRSNVVESAGLGCYHPAAIQLAEAQGPHAKRVSDPQEFVLGENGERVCPFELPHHVGYAPLPVHGGSVGEQVGDDFGVACAVEPESVFFHLPSQIYCVDDVAVVRHRQLYAGAARDDRLSVDDAIGAGGGVASVGDRYVAGQVLEVVFSEGLADQPHGRASSE